MEQALGGEIPAEARGHLDRIHSSIARMRQLIDDLLAIARIGRQEAPMAELDMGELVGEVLDQLEEFIRPIGVEVCLPPSLPRVRYRDVQLRQVFANLIENAIKFMGNQPSPRVDVACRRTEGGVEITVRDNGMGIAPEFHDRIFEIFHRLPQASDVPGTGLGLTLVRRIVELHGGRIWVESAHGQGAAFSFSIPASLLLAQPE
jgi:signal transduction histidine kinase